MQTMRIAEAHATELGQHYDERVRSNVNAALDYHAQQLARIAADEKHPETAFEQRRKITRIAISRIQKAITPNLYYAFVLGRFRSRASITEGKPLEIRRKERRKKTQVGPVVRNPRRSSPESLSPKEFKRFVAATEKKIVGVVRKDMHETGRDIEFIIDAEKLHKLLLTRMLQAFSEGVKAAQ